MENYGLEVYNEDGSLRDKITSKFARIITKLHVPIITGYDYARNNGVSGEFIVNELLSVPNGYRPFYFISPAEMNGCFYPNVEISGRVVKWDFAIYDKELFPVMNDKKNGVADLFGDNPMGIDYFKIAGSEISGQFGGCYINIGICPNV